MNTQDKILQITTQIFAREGANGVSIRKLAQKTKIAPSVIYHYFANKEVLLKRMFRQAGRNLGVKRKLLPDTDTASAMLKQRIAFQIDHAEEVVAVLKFFLTYRKLFPKRRLGYVPDKAYLHIQEVLMRGVKSGEFIPLDIQKEAKVITHAINGFLLEYFPKKPTATERAQLIDSIYEFVIRSIAARD